MCGTEASAPSPEEEPVGFAGTLSRSEDEPCVIVPPAL